MGKSKIEPIAGPIKGVVTRSAQTKLNPGEYAMLRNVELVEDVGIFSIRKGTQNAHTSAMSGAYPVRGGIRWSYGVTPTRETVFAHNQKLYKDPSNPTQLAATTFTADKEWYFAPYENYLFCTNGTDACQRWDGTTLRAAGFAAPSTNLTGAVGAGGVLTGTYKYKYTFVYDSVVSHESSASAVSGNVVLTADQADLSSIDVGAGGSGVTSRRIYRTKAGGSLFYYLATIADNTTTTYTDNIADTALGLDQAPTDNGVPPVAQYQIFYRGRHVRANGGTASTLARLYLAAIVSTERNPIGTLSVHGAGAEIFPSDHYIDIGDDNTPIRGLAVWNDMLVIFKENSIFMMKGEAASGINVWKVDPGIGCIAPRSIVDMGARDGIYFLGRGETTPMVYSFKGGPPDAVGDIVERTFRENCIGLGGSYTVQPAGGRYRGQYLLSYAYAATPTYEVAKYDTRLKRWSWDRNVSPSCWIPYTGTGDAGEMYFGHAIAGWIVQWDKLGGDFTEAASTNPTDAQMYIETGWMDMGSPHGIKQAGYIYVSGEAQTTATITVQRFYSFKSSGTTAGAASKALTETITGGGFQFRVDPQMEGGATQAESGLQIKLKITVDVPYTGRTDPFLAVRIHDINMEYVEMPWTDLEQIY